MITPKDASAAAYKTGEETDSDHEAFKTLTWTYWDGKNCSDAATEDLIGRCKGIESNIKYDSKAMNWEPKKTEKDAAAKAASLKTKWAGKTCSDEANEALKTECTTAQAAGTTLLAGFLAVGSLVATL